MSSQAGGLDGRPPVKLGEGGKSELRGQAHLEKIGTSLLLEGVG